MRRRTAPAGSLHTRIPGGRSTGERAARVSGRRAFPARAGLLAVLCLAPAAVAGEEPDEPDDPAAATRSVELDKLLELPDSLDYGVERRGGLTRSEWQARFQGARSAIEEAETKLARAQEELEGLASETSQWQLAPPGAGAANPEAPLSYRLRQDIRRYKARRERATRHLRDLQIEANLAGVPDSWREPPARADTADP